MQQKNPQSGFTLIEMIVSLAVFSIVITTSVGALLVLVGTNEQLQSEQNVMTNLSFALDSMTREIRTGTNYYCHNASQDRGVNEIFANTQLNIDEISRYRDPNTNDCLGSSQRFRGLIFTEGGDSITTETAQRIMYFFDRNERVLYRRVGNDIPRSIIADSIEINDMRFYVTGSEDNPTTQQPVVTMYIEAREAGTNDPYEVIQTTVTQRVLDL